LRLFVPTRQVSEQTNTEPGMRHLFYTSSYHLQISVISVISGKGFRFLTDSRLFAHSRNLPRLAVGSRPVFGFASANCYLLAANCFCSPSASSAVELLFCSCCSLKRAAPGHRPLLFTSWECRAASSRCLRGRGYGSATHIRVRSWDRTRSNSCPLELCPRHWLAA
jgi:hypothetical protein